MSKSKDKNLKTFTYNLDSIELLESNDDISIVKLRLLHLGVNRNKCDITKEACDSSLASLFYCPIVYKLNNKYFPENSTDVLEHAKGIDVTMMIAGCVPESTTINYVKDEDNGKTYLEVDAIIYKAYQPTLMKILEKRNGNVKISIEIYIVDGAQNEDGIIEFEKMTFKGITLLGEKVVEGIEGSDMNVIKFSEKEIIEQLNDKYKTFSVLEKKYKIDDKIKDSIKDIVRRYKNNLDNISEKNFAVLSNFSHQEEFTIKNINELKSILNEFSTDKNLLSLENWCNTLIENEVHEMKIGVNELREKLYDYLKQYKYHDGSYEAGKYWIHEIYADEKEVVYEDNETNKMYISKYEIESDGSAKVDLEDKKSVRWTLTGDKDYEDEKNDNAWQNSLVFSKTNYGSSSAVKIDKSKDSMSDGEWGSVNKSELRKKVLDSSNYKTLVKDVYMQVEEGWEDSPSTKLKYPVMEIKDGKAVYNRGGLASAKGYAEKENDTEVINKLEKIYKDLELDKDEKENFSMDTKKNKLDKDNKDLEKIRDDAQAQEDDEKEKLKKNEIEDDDEGKEDLEGDVDSDKDYWKKKYDNTVIENSELKKEVAKYVRQELEEKMSSCLNEYAENLGEDDVEELKNAMKEFESEEQFTSKIYEKIAKNVKKNKKEIKNSYVPSPFGANMGYASKNSEKAVSNIFELQEKLHGGNK